MRTLPLLDPASASAAQSQFIAQVPPLNLFRALAHAPGLATMVAQMGETILFQTKLDPRLREMAILRAAHLACNDYEIGHHERIGRDVGLTEADLAATRPGACAAELDEPARLVLQWSDAAALEGGASPDLAASVLAHFGAEQAVELSITVGYYLMVAQFLKSFDIPYEGAGFSDGVKIPPAGA